MPRLDQLSAQLDRLAACEPGPFPVISLYLNTQSDQHGRDRFEPFLRKELADRIQTYPGGGPERASLERDGEKIRAFVGTIDPSSNGVAVFACSNADLFETMQLSAPLPEHRLYISDAPHLYPLARIIDEYPRYAVVIADTNGARMFVFAANALEHERRLEGTKTRRHKMGGWAQARYQRHVDNYHLHHAKEIVDTLDRIVRDEGIQSIVLAGDEVIVPLLRDQLPKHLAEKIVDVLKLDRQMPEREVLETTIATMREKDAQTDRERVDALLSAYRANGLAVIGIDRTRQALERGQVDELVISAVPATISARKGAAASEPHPAERSAQERTADELIATARRTSADVRFIEEASLLAPIGGVGAFLRFKL